MGIFTFICQSMAGELFMIVRPEETVDGVVGK